MTLKGKGFMIWKVPNCESGDPKNIAAAAKSAGLSHVLIKIADADVAYNVDNNTHVDLVPPVVQALHNLKIQAWGWHYVYGENPLGEARIAGKRVKDLGLDGYVIDAEVEYKLPGRDAAARTFMSELRKLIPSTPVALCSFRFPTIHPQLPWKDFLNQCDYNMPQVYWQEAHNPGDQLRRSVREFQNLSPVRPVIPTGPVYSAAGWVPTDTEITEFLNTARTLNLSAANFFAWDYRKKLPSLWNAVSAFPWPVAPGPKELPELYIDALNTHNASKVVSLFTSDAVQITSSQTVQGTAAITDWFTKFFTNTFVDGKFTLTGISGTGSSRSFTWSGVSSKGKINNGNDTLGVIGDKIAYHYTYFTITP